MMYRVEVTAAAEASIDRYISYIADERLEPLNAARVLRAIWDAIPSLELMPFRCPRAPEDQFVDYTVRMLIVKKTLFLLYRVDEDARLVTVIGFRHSSQLPLPPEELAG